MKVFLPQLKLEEWTLAEQADIRGQVLHFTGETQTYPVTDALHFATLVSGPDERKLKGKVKTQTQVQGLGAEVLSNSAIVGESAYEVEPGYVVEVPKGDSSRLSQTGEADLLANYLLKKL